MVNWLVLLKGKALQNVQGIMAPFRKWQIEPILLALWHSPPSKAQNVLRMASFLCRREKGGDCIQDLSLSVVKILLFNKSPITTPFVNKCQKWFSWLTKAWGWWGRWWVAGKVKLVTTGSTCLEAKLSYISLSEAFSRLFYFISSPRAFLQFELYY